MLLIDSSAASAEFEARCFYALIRPQKKNDSRGRKGIMRSFRKRKGNRERRFFESAGMANVSFVGVQPTASSKPAPQIKPVKENSCSMNNETIRVLKIIVREAGFALAAASIETELRLTAQNMAALIVVSFFEEDYARSDAGLRKALALLPLCESFLQNPWSTN